MRTKLARWMSCTLMGTVALVTACAEPTQKTPSMALIDTENMTWEKQTAALQVAVDCDSALVSFKQMLTT